jgi:acyl-CoA reductase-like NAD-dependent aldehyde dehydrogenase
MLNDVTFLDPDLRDHRLLKFPHYQMLIDGKMVEAKSGQRMQRESPAHKGAIVGSYPEASPEDVDLAVQAARKAFDEGPWPRMSGAERSKILFRAADLLQQHIEELATVECLESGKPIVQARREMARCVDSFQYAAGQIRGLHGETHNGLGSAKLALVLREPIGVVGIITPWNFPLVLVSERIPWALGAGCTVVCKPSEFTPGTTLRLGAFLNEAGVPSGAINIISGYGDPAGQALLDHPQVDMIAFTGSVRVGKKVLLAAAGNIKKVGLELGGKGPQIVFADADIAAAVDGVAFGAYHNAGQCCISGSRLIIEESVADDFLSRLVAISKTVPVGDPLHESTKIGAVINSVQLAKIQNYIEEGLQAGAKTVIGGNLLAPDRGFYYSPTIFHDVNQRMSIANEEIFGPVLTTQTFKTFDEAVALANSTVYGLSGSVWTTNMDKGIQTVRSLRIGRVWINTVMEGFPEIPFGGYKQSGLGRESGQYGFDEYSEFKSVVMHLGKRTFWWNPEKN